MIKQLDGIEINESDMVIGETYRRYNSCGGYVEFTHQEIDIKPIESEWVLSELQRTDNLVKLPDYPHMDILIAYRADLRKYDLKGNRPVLPTTPKGTLI